MVIHHEKLPFKVCFYQTWYKDDKVINKEEKLVEFFSDYDEEDIAQITEIRELIDTSVILRAKSEDSIYDLKLYIDGIDVLDKVVVNENDIYIPNGMLFPIYIQRKNDRSYPWIPGLYRIIVECEGVKYYSYVNVIPLHIKENELDVLRSDIENISEGLARELVLQRKGVIYSNNDGYLSPLFLDKYYVLKSVFNKLRYVLNDIVKEPLREVVKYYELTPANKAKKVDDKTNKWFLSLKGQIYNSGDKKQAKVLLCPKAVLEDNILVNQWIKHILSIIVYTLNKNIKALEEYEEFYKSEIEGLKRFNNGVLSGGQALLKNRQWALEEIKRIKTESSQYISFIKSVLNSELFNKINKLSDLKLPMILLREKRYRFLYNIYRAFTDNIQVIPKGIFEFQWKSTDRLYEYWCYIKLITLLTEMGYTPVRGWIFDKITNRNKFAAFIKDGTVIEMVNGNCTLLLIFNKEISLDKHFSIANEEYIWSKLGNNKPDIRIDVFFDKIFRHSVVIDAKYRNPEAVWDKKKTKECRRPATMIQLSNYKLSFENPNVPDKSVVKRVFAFCPKLINGFPYDEDDDHGITVAFFKPNIDFSHVKVLLQKNISMETY
ncbi:nuclease domain-containing protein [Petroclostridium xylanilyticum]|uniref:nuclease domain-containing protein n=1 Tax=Petroclostridium xylanilyticum TaxID=1792311 RepID=UPI000B97DC9B|nr:nuclease domain-containing protein [Petroclostridium xylanilyticum]